jgi:hypothetical protein
MSKPLIIGAVSSLPENFAFAEARVPAFPTDQVRGLKAHGTTIGKLPGLDLRLLGDEEKNGAG